MSGKFLPATFWALVGMFIIILCQFFVPAFEAVLVGSKLFLVPFIVFSLLGGTLLFLTLKKKMEKKLKIFLILTGASAAGFVVFAVLHNVFYALEIVTSNIIALSYSMEILHVIFFLLAIPVCPIGFLVGATGTIVLGVKQSCCKRKVVKKLKRKK